MSMMIKNSSNGDLATVTSEGKLKTFATTETRASYVSQVNGEAYTWSAAYDYDANDTILWLRNNSTTKLLIIEKVIISSDTTTQFVLHFPNNATPAGTLVSGVNLNKESTNSANSICYQDETNNVQGDIIKNGIMVANGNITMPVDGAFILGHNHCIALDFVTAGTLGTVTIRGYYIDK